MAGSGLHNCPVNSCGGILSQCSMGENDGGRRAGPGACGTRSEGFPPVNSKKCLPPGVDRSHPRGRNIPVGHPPVLPNSSILQLQ